MCHRGKCIVLEKIFWPALECPINKLKSHHCRFNIFGCFSIESFCWTSFYFRYLLISYLHPLAPGQGGIFVKKTSILEGMDFKVFIRPFRNWLWIVMIISSFAVALCIIGVLKIQDSSQMDLKDCMRIMVITIQTNFGSGNFNSLPKLSMEAPRLIIITALLMGNIIWLSYNGSLLSALITPSVIKPFDDLESLAKTNFR